MIRASVEGAWVTVELTDHHREQAARLLGLLEGLALHPESNVSDVLTSYRYTYELITCPIPLCTRAEK